MSQIGQWPDKAPLVRWKIMKPPAEEPIKSDDFRDFVLTPRAFIRSIIVIRLVGFYASERPVNDYASNSQSDRV